MRLRALRTSTVLSVVLLASVAACDADSARPSPEPPKSSKSSTAPSPSPSTARSSADLELAPGRIGAATVGMDRDAALSTGLFDADPAVVEGCERVLTWKKQYDGADVLTGDDDAIVALGVDAADGPRTTEDLGVGSTLGELVESYGGDLSAPQQAGYGQVGVFVQDGNNWLGFLLGDATSVEQVVDDPAFEVTLAEATKFNRPDLIRDGC